MESKLHPGHGLLGLVDKETEELLKQGLFFFSHIALLRLHCYTRMVCKRPSLISREISAFSFCQAVQAGAGRYKQALLMLRAAQTHARFWKMQTHVDVARSPDERALPLRSVRQLPVILPLRWVCRCLTRRGHRQSSSVLLVPSTYVIALCHCMLSPFC